MIITIIDCYTDEPAGLGVPPYIGTYPRYIYGSIIESGNSGYYITIDDLRAYFSKKGSRKEINDSNEKRIKTDIDDDEWWHFKKDIAQNFDVGFIPPKSYDPIEYFTKRINLYKCQISLLSEL